jgi:hypothetical protein
MTNLPSSTTDWSQRRRRLVHDDILNDFRLGLEKLRQVTSGDVIDSRFVPKFADDYGAKLAHIQTEVVALLDDAPQALSPVDRLRQSLSPSAQSNGVIDHLEHTWSQRFLKNSVMQGCRSALSATVQSFEHLLSTLSGQSVTDTTVCACHEMISKVDDLKNQLGALPRSVVWCFSDGKFLHLS